MCRRAVPEWAAWTWTTGTAPHWRIFPACSGRNKNISYKLKIFTSQIQPAVLHGDGVGLPHLGHQHLHGRQQGAAQEDVWRGAAGAARAGSHARRHGKNICMFPQKIFDQTKTISGEDCLHSAAVHGGAARHNPGLPGAGETFENQDTVHTEETCDYSDQNIAMNLHFRGSGATCWRARWRRWWTWRPCPGPTPLRPRGWGGRQSSPATRTRTTPSESATRDTCLVWHVTVQNWRVRVQDRGVHPLLGQQQQRQGDDSIVEDDRWYWW